MQKNSSWQIWWYLDLCFENAVQKWAIAKTHVFCHFKAVLSNHLLKVIFLNDAVPYYMAMKYPLCVIKFITIKFTICQICDKSNQSLNLL